MQTVLLLAVLDHHHVDCQQKTMKKKKSSGKDPDALLGHGKNIPGFSQQP